MATPKQLYEHYVAYKKAKLAKRVHAIVKDNVDPDFSASELMRLYETKNWNSLIKNDLEGHFEMYSEDERKEILSLWLKELGDPIDVKPQPKPIPKPQPKPAPNPVPEQQKKTPKIKDVKLQPKVEEPVIEGSGLEFLDMSMNAIFTKLALDQMPRVKKAIEGKLEQMIDDEASKRVPTQIIINEVEKGKVVGKKHEKFEKLLAKIFRHRKSYLSGPTGSGKTFLAEQISTALDLRFASISMTAGLSEGHLTGRTTINGDYLTAEFVDFYENGGVYLVDEVDAADSNTLLTLNKALSNAVGGTINVPYRVDKPQATMHKDFYIICAGNTWGDGDDGDYVGREMLDRAFMNRFATCKIEISYDEILEEGLLNDCPELFRRFREIRRNITKGNVNQVVATRTMVDARIDYLDGDDIDTIVDDFMVGWSQEEKEKAING